LSLHDALPISPECLRSAKARLSARPCRQRLRPASGRSLGNPARSCPSVHLPFSPSGLSHSYCRSRRPPVGQLVACSVRTPEPLQHDPHPQVTLLSLEMSLKTTGATEPRRGQI